jgi:hypothetical protein
MNFITRDVDTCEIKREQLECLIIIEYNKWNNCLLCNAIHYLNAV